MKINKFYSYTLFSIAALTLSGLANAEGNSKNYGYVTDTWGNIVRDSYGDCWHTGYWTPAMAIAECEPHLVKKEVPKVEAKPAPVPPVKVAAPVVEPKPVEKWKTTVIEKPVLLEGASFETGSSKLLSGAAGKLEQVVNSANKDQDIDLTVAGYTDNRGSAKMNLDLSLDRANAVKAYLVSKGIAADRITTKGLGEANPIADNSTDEGMSTNRRVEVSYSVKEEKRVRVIQ